MKKERKTKAGRPKGIIAAKRPRGDRPRWINLNKTLVALAYLANDEGVVVATVKQISEAALLPLRSLGDAFNHLEERLELYFLDAWSHSEPITIVLADSPIGEKVGAYIHDLEAKRFGLPRESPGPADFAPPMAMPAIQ